MTLRTSSVAPLSVSSSAPQAAAVLPAPKKPALGYSDASAYVGAVQPRAARPKHGFELAFERIIGPEAVKSLVASFTTEPLVLVAGELCSGKGTACDGLATALGGTKENARSTGQMIRGVAKAQGLTAQELRAKSMLDPTIDVRVDYVQAHVIASGFMDVTGDDGKTKSVRVLTLDSRLAGLMGAWLRGLGRKNLFMVNLTCAPRERALRLVQRQFSPEVRARIDAALKVPADADVATCFAAIQNIDDPATKHAAEIFANEAARDDEDRQRLKKHYGVDSFDKSMFDLNVDTSSKTPAEVVAAIMKALPAGVRGA